MNGLLRGEIKDDDGYWSDVEQCYREILMRDRTCDDLLAWKIAKVVVRDQYEDDKSFEKASREGRPFEEVQTEDMRRRRLEKQAIEKEGN